MNYTRQSLCETAYAHCYSNRCGHSGHWPIIIVSLRIKWPKNLKTMLLPVPRNGFQNHLKAWYVKRLPTVSIWPFHFSIKVHSTWALLFTPHHFQLTLCNASFSKNAKMPLTHPSTILKYWLKDDEPWNWTATAGDLTRQSAGLSLVVLSLSLARSNVGELTLHRNFNNWCCRCPVG